VGNTLLFSQVSTNGNRRAMLYTMPEDGIIQSITMYHEAGNGKMLLGLYADDGQGKPGSRLGVTAETDVSIIAGWQTADLIAPVFVSASTHIWLAWIYESNPGIRYQSGAPGRAQSNEMWNDGMPTSYGPSSRSNYIYSIYATYIPFVFDECVLDPKFNNTSIDVGEHYYADRSYTITGGIPSWMVDRTLIQTPNNERFNNAASGYLRFTTPVSWWVYVLFDSRASSLPDWLNGWEHRSQYKIYTSLKPQPYLEVWRKHFNAGQCVDLGGNFGPGSSNENRSNFVVVYGK
jgi:hypothetical protein